MPEPVVGTIVPAGPHRVATAATTPFVRAVGVAALTFSALYFVSDVLELVQDGFSTPQLMLTYLAEAAVPLFVLGLYAVQRPHIGALGLLGAVGYAYAYIFFTGTVLLALVDDSPDWNSLADDLGVWVILHGLLMMVAGSAFGMAVFRARVLPRWTGALLVAGVVLVALASVLPSAAQVLCAGVRDLAFAGMGFSLLAGKAPTAGGSAGSATAGWSSASGRRSLDSCRRPTFRS